MASSFICNTNVRNVCAFTCGKTNGGLTRINEDKLYVDAQLNDEYIVNNNTTKVIGSVADGHTGFLGYYDRPHGLGYYTSKYVTSKNVINDFETKLSELHELTKSSIQEVFDNVFTIPTSKFSAGTTMSMGVISHGRLITIIAGDALCNLYHDKKIIFEETQPVECCTNIILQQQGSFIFSHYSPSTHDITSRVGEHRAVVTRFHMDNFKFKMYKSFAKLDQHNFVASIIEYIQKECPTHIRIPKNEYDLHINEAMIVFETNGNNTRNLYNVKHGTPITNDFFLLMNNSTFGPPSWLGDKHQKIRVPPQIQIHDLILNEKYTLMLATDGIIAANINYNDPNEMIAKLGAETKFVDDTTVVCLSLQRVSG